MPGDDKRRGRGSFVADSTVLAHCMKVLNDRYNYGLELFLLSIDEGITGYRDDSLEVSPYSNSSELCYSTCVLQTVKRNQQQYDLPLKILSYDELYGWTMDRIVEQVGRKNNCSLRHVCFWSARLSCSCRRHILWRISQAGTRSGGSTVGR